MALIMMVHPLICIFKSRNMIIRSLLGYVGILWMIADDIPDNMVRIPSCPHYVTPHHVAPGAIPDNWTFQSHRLTGECGSKHAGGY